MTQVATQPNTQEQMLEKVKMASQKRFEALQANAIQISEQCKSIAITDPDTLSIAMQTLSKSNEVMKAVDDKRSEIKAPYLQAGKLIDSMAKTILEPIEAGMVQLKNKLKVWNTEQEKLQNAAAIENQKKYELLKGIEAQLNEKVKIAVTPDQCDKLIASINEKFPAAERFVPYASEANLIKAKFINLLSNKKQLACAAAKNDADKVQEVVERQEEIIQEQQEASVLIEDRKEMITEANIAVKSKTRKVWKFEIVDDAKLPRQFLCADEKKIREYMNNNKATFGKEKIVGGVKFYEDETPIA